MDSSDVTRISVQVAACAAIVVFHKLVCSEVGGVINL
jgi:hypothetical protein